MVTLGKVATVAGLESDVELTKPPKSLRGRLDTFTENLKGTLQYFADTASGKALATSGPTRASMTSAASDWQKSVKEVVDKWIQMTREAIEVLHACTATATAERGNATEAAKQAKDLQEKIANWLNSLKNQVDETWQLPVVLDKEKADAALEEYENRVEEAKENTLEDLKDMVNAILAASEEEAHKRRAQRVEKVLEPLGRLVVACGAATAIFLDLRCAVGTIKATLEGTKEESPDVPKDLVAKVKQLRRDSEKLVNDHLYGITWDVRELIRGDTCYKKVAEKCQEAINSL
ncbi:hypothetical protein TURU_000819 [Turdus rufiventris]|nr:hypothetical protein TURU_000819 [Turdus rufiventris]